MVFAVSSATLVGLLTIYWYGSREFRSLPESVCAELARLPERRSNQHVVDVELRDGRVGHKVWVAYGRYPAVIGGRMLIRHYRPKDVVRALPHE